jgi:hypothetical protein
MTLRIAEERLRDAHRCRMPEKPPRRGLPAVEVHEREELLHAAGEVLARDAFEAAEVGEELGGREPFVDAEVLRQEAQLAPNGKRVRHAVLPVPHEAALRGLRDRREDRHERRLPRAVRAQEAEHALTERERHVLQGDVPVGIGLGKAFELKQVFLRLRQERQVLQKVPRSVAEIQSAGGVPRPGGLNKFTGRT